jgi:hypothetical protein
MMKSTYAEPTQRKVQCAHFDAIVSFLRTARPPLSWPLDQL